MLVPLESSSAVLVMISSKSVSICNRFHARWANSGQIMISKGGTPLWCPHSRGLSSPTGTKLPHRKLDTPGYHARWRPGVSISLGLKSVPGRDGQTDGRTDRQTDRIPIANIYAPQQYLPVQLWRVKTVVLQNTIEPLHDNAILLLLLFYYYY